MKQPDEIEAELQRSLSLPLPAEEAHRRLLPPGRPLHPPDCVRYRPAAVLVPLYREADALHTLLIVRPATMSRHGGEVAFPGGLREGSDASPVQTALRETEEELGLDPASVHVVGLLSEVCIPPSRLRVRPVVGWMRALPPLHPNPTEVAQVLKVPLSSFRAKAPLRRWRPPTWDRAVACFAVHGLCVWGATAMMLSELMAVVDGVESKIARRTGQTVYGE